MRTLLTSVLAVAAALLATSALGVAAAEAPTGASALRTISVGGVSVVPIADHASAAVADATYREAMAKALADAQSKASLLAEKAGAALGVVDSLIEEGGYIECSTGAEDYAPYEGEQPDFGSGPRVTGAVAPLAAASAEKGRVSHRPKHKHRRHRARSASAVSCNLTADVAAVFGMS